MFSGINIFEAYIISGHWSKSIGGGGPELGGGGVGNPIFFKAILMG